MRLLHVILGLMVAGGLLLAVGVSPRPAIAVGQLTVQNGTTYPCTRDGLASAIADVDASGTVTFNCPDPTVITFGENDQYIEIDKTVSIIGLNGTSNIILDGQKDDGFDTNFFRVTAGGHLRLEHMTLQHGSTPNTVLFNLGGAINVLESGKLDVTAVTFIDNEADWGGAINAWANTTVAIASSSFLRNHAVQGGGALDNGGTITVSQSSFVENSSSRDGGAIFHFDGDIAIVSSTFAGNTAPQKGSTFYAGPGNLTMSINWTTIWQPKGVTPAIYAEHSIDVTGVILGGFGTHCELPRNGELVNSYTLSNETSCGLDSTMHSQEGVSDLGLGPLQTSWNNGVDQGYYPLLIGSPAINTGPENCDTLIDEDTVSDLDQFRHIRPNETFCDIGAFESDQPPIIEASSPGGNEGQSVPFNVNIIQIASEARVQVDCISDGTWTDVEDGCLYPDDGTFNATFLVTDGYEVGIAITSVTIANLDPEIKNFQSSTLTALTGELVTFTTTADDVPTDEPLIYTYDCEGGEQVGKSACRFDRGGEQQVTVTASDGDGGTATRSLTIQVYDAVTFCVSNWGGQLRVVDGDCGRSEHVVTLPQPNFAPLALCVNDWNGSTRLGDDCGRSEHEVSVAGQDTVAVCVNRWNGSLRVSMRCSRSEFKDWL